MKTFTRMALWLLWCLVVFGALNIRGAPAGYVDGKIAADPAPVYSPIVEHLLWVLRDDGDIRRYFAYGEAMLGRPYDSDFVDAAKPADPAAATKGVIVTPDRPLIPWRDFSVEYPPGMLIVALLPALLTSDFPTYLIAFSVLMGILLTITTKLCVRMAETLRPGAGTAALLLSTAFVLGLGGIAIRRYDALVAVALAAMFHALVVRRPYRSGFWLTFGAAAKGAPLALSPLGVIFLFKRARKYEAWRAMFACIVTLGAASFGYSYFAGPRAFALLAYHMERPVQIETLYGSVMMTLSVFDPGIMKVAHSFGSDNIDSVWEPLLRRVSSYAPPLAILGVVVWFWRVIDHVPSEERSYRALFAGSTAILVALIALGKVSSPQYAVWLLPVGVMASALSSNISRALFILGYARASRISLRLRISRRVPCVPGGAGDAVAQPRADLLRVETPKRRPYRALDDCQQPLEKPQSPQRGRGPDHQRQDDREADRGGADILHTADLLVMGAGDAVAEFLDRRVEQFDDHHEQHRANQGDALPGLARQQASRRDRQREHHQFLAERRLETGRPAQSAPGIDEGHQNTSQIRLRERDEIPRRIEFDAFRPSA